MQYLKKCIQYDYFFSKLSSIVNFASVSFKHYPKLRSIREKETIDLIAYLEELETSTGTNQFRTLKKGLEILIGPHILL